MSEILTISKIIERLSAGDIRIPAFQRDWVWEPDNVAFLLDSIYKGFPIGTIILWKTNQRLQSDKNLGYFVLPEPKKDYPVNYVLDGQQRLTSIFSVFQTSLQPTTNEWVDIYFDLDAVENIQESTFLALDIEEVNKRRHFPVKTFFDSVAYRKATENLTEDQTKKIDSVQRKFIEYMIPNIVFETEDMNNVAIVFERINRAGKELNVFELLSAWSWSDKFDLKDKFDELQVEIADHGFEDLCNDRDLQLRIIAGVIKKDTLPSTIIELNGEEIRNEFNKVSNGILGAIDYLKRELKIEHFKLIPFPGLLVPLSYFFATHKTDGQKYSSKQNEVIKKWFWRSLFSRRFSSGVNERQSADILQMDNLLKDENYHFKFPPAEIKIDFIKDIFSLGNANSKTMICLLNQCNPHSLLSGAKIDLSNVLKKGSKHEYHHIFPKKYLESLNISSREINCLANICFLTRSDNNTIKAQSPKIYNNYIDTKFRDSYLTSALIPFNFNETDYESFKKVRKEMLEKKVLELIT